jgi:hypothetical protein
MNGKEIPLEHNYPRNMSDSEAIPYTTEAENFIQEIVNRITVAQTKLQSLFERDYFNKNELSLSDKINLLINSKQKLLE